MSGPLYALERAVAISAVVRACSLTSKVFHSLVTAETVTKKDKSPVTVGDFSAQAVVNTVLAAHFPQDAIVGEEDSADLRGEGEDKVKLRQQIYDLANEALARPEQDCPAEQVQENKWGSAKVDTEQLLKAIDRGNSAGGRSGRMWALDPIDGTKGFLRGGQYAVCLALIVDGQVELGVMGCPNLPHDAASPKPKEGDPDAKSRSDLGVIFVAVRGQGAFQRPINSSVLTPIKMRSLKADATSLASASFCESVEAGHSSQGTNARIAELLGIKSAPVRMDSQAKYASISRGDGDFYLRLPVGDGSYQEKIWDHAAGALLVEEAGGRVSDLAGRPLDFGQGRTLKANKGVIAAFAGEDVHSKVLEAVQQAVKEEGRAFLLE
ncbi:3'(2'),5'-bisphosphate nucleotidase [Tilletia horrida]|uniref:3'(2'),5'-bisphosphate nucleotidase n=1 Tax=Tilletia horrida TaxID=155126 RepID=A0AAN6JIC6_9BASI|nr:3'(2'),5'-bisphosphate nucleotidase [Tilletia horrida]KAK0523558.1 3'(2'),5'-bisphosphate nucleotidase [Tilletia horrida]KAK0529592.1 3'(2'),5'-bisphosphate nucleotidase [Tilletia horrida]KAK0558387.1 3'(2'),5'-bisphosphate nucleotidase [Tilletia horrida]